MSYLILKFLNQDFIHSVRVLSKI